MKKEALDDFAAEVLGPAKREQRQREQDRLRKRLRELKFMRALGVASILAVVYLISRLVARGQLFDVVTLTMGIVLVAQVHLLLRDPETRRVQSRLDALSDDSDPERDDLVS